MRTAESQKKETKINRLLLNTEQNLRGTLQRLLKNMTNRVFQLVTTQYYHASKGLAHLVGAGRHHRMQ